MTTGFPILAAHLEQSQIHQDLEVAAELNLQLGRLYQLQSKYEAAVIHFATSANGFKNLKDYRRQAHVLGRQALIAHLQHRHPQVKELVSTALDLLDETDTERAGIYAILGDVALKQHQYQQSIDYFERTLQLWEQTDNIRMIAWSLRDLGPPLRGLGRDQDAIDCYERALQLFSQINDPVHMASTQMNLGVVYMMNRQSQHALDLFALAEPVFRQTRDKLRLAMVYTNQGITYGQLKNWQQAKSRLKAGIELYEQVGDIRSLVNVLGELGLTYQAQEDTSHAIQVFQEALSQLSKISDQPGYQPLYEEITMRLQQAIEQV